MIVKMIKPPARNPTYPRDAARPKLWQTPADLDRSPIGTTREIESAPKTERIKIMAVAR